MHYTLGNSSHSFDDIFTRHITCKYLDYDSEIFSCEESLNNVVRKSFGICRNSLTYLDRQHNTHMSGRLDFWSLDDRGSSTRVAYFGYNGQPILSVPGEITAQTFNATSDRRLKENIKTFEPHKSILDLDVVEFEFKDTKQHTIGCIAQELQEICPEIVHENSEGYLTIEENKIVYLLLDEVKKLKEEIKELKGE